MSLDDSIASIMTRLTDWSRFPKYQLERRVDIFLTPFLESFVSHELKRPAVLVAPEFPLLADLRNQDPGANRDALSGRTVNADYLFHLPGDKPGWLFLELKTDAGSFDPEQARLYSVAKQRGMPALIEDIGLVHELTEKRHRQKYDKLRSALAALSGNRPEPILIAYLAPSALRPDVEEKIDHFLSLDAFTEQEFARIPPEHHALWPYVRDLLRAIRTP